MSTLGGTGLRSGIALAVEARRRAISIAIDDLGLAQRVHAVIDAGGVTRLIAGMLLRAIVHAIVDAGGHVVFKAASASITTAITPSVDDGKEIINIHDTVAATGWNDVS